MWHDFDFYFITLESSGQLHCSYITSTRKAKAMGGVLSKVFRPVVIDLTKDNDEPPQTQTQQHPLPEFTYLLLSQDPSAGGTGITFGTPSLRTLAFGPNMPLTAVDKAFNLTGSSPGSAINKPEERTGVNDVFFWE
jgi:hypothetical protein